MDNNVLIFFRGYTFSSINIQNFKLFEETK